MSLSSGPVPEEACMKGHESRWLIAVGVASVLSAGALAGPTTALRIDANSSLGSGYFEVTLDDGVTLPDGSFFWSLGAPVTITDTNSGMSIATLSFGSIMLGASGVVSHSFVVQAGNAATNFALGSGLVNLGPIANPYGRASSGITLTDTNGDGANLTGNFAGGTMFEAFYDAGAVFANLLTGPFGFATPFDSKAMSDEYPAGAGNFAAFTGPASQIGIHWDFLLSANDSAGGTSVFVVIPTPAAATMLLAGFGVMTSRRRR